MKWQGVFPAITTPFAPDLTVDHPFLAEHAAWLAESGCPAVVALGSLGEAATLDFDEKLAVLTTLVQALHGKADVMAGISSTSTHEAVRLAQAAQAVGCKALMVLPQYVYKGDWRENKAHFQAVMRATPLPCMLYNNPVAYGIDVLPEQIEELADSEPNLQAVKESSTDVRRITAIRALLHDRLSLFVGVDDAIVEGIRMGAVGWIAGLVNAYPKESVLLFELATANDPRAEELYAWFLPLLRLDTLPKFVQYIKLAQQQVGMGSERVRPPRLVIEGKEREQVLRTIESAMGASRPS